MYVAYKASVSAAKKNILGHWHLPGIANFVGNTGFDSITHKCPEACRPPGAKTIKHFFFGNDAQDK
jgi:hypothetical protein